MGRVDANLKFLRRHQLGLHTAVSQHKLTDGERNIRQRILAFSRGLEYYLASSLGLPRSVRATADINQAMATAPQAHTTETVAAADANQDLFEILGSAMEKCHFTERNAQTHGANLVSRASLDEIDSMLEEWAGKHPSFARMNGNTLKTYSRSEISKHTREFELRLTSPKDHSCNYSFRSALSCS